MAKIRYRKQFEDVKELEEALTLAGIPWVRCEFGPGGVQVEADLTASQEAALDKILLNHYPRKEVI